MKILAIDPGNKKSAFVLYDPDKNKLIEIGLFQNKDIVQDLIRINADIFVIEMIASYGMSVGQTVFDTCVWIGRFIQVIWEYKEKDAVLMYRKDVKMNLCNSMRAKDGNIRQALIDRFPDSGGGKVPQVGIKSKPGPLYGVAKDIWAALGVAVTYCEMEKL